MATMLRGGRFGFLYSRSVQLLCSNSVPITQISDSFPYFSRSLVSHDDDSTATEPNRLDDMHDKQNIARLPEQLHRRMSQTPPTEESSAHLKVQTQRQLYAYYGSESGINPGIMWPSKEELADQLEYEKLCEPSLATLLATSRERKTAKLQKELGREEYIDAQLKQMPKLIEKFHVKHQKHVDEENEAKAKQEKLLDEARDHFGYDIPMRDPRFMEFKEAKRVEERDTKRKARREEKDAASVQKMQDTKDKLKQQSAK